MGEGARRAGEGVAASAVALSPSPSPASGRGEQSPSVVAWMKSGAVLGVAPRISSGPRSDWRQLERRLIEACFIDLQRPALAIPVPQHDTACRLAAHVQLMHRWAMGMPVDQGAHAMLGHHPDHFL